MFPAENSKRGRKGVRLAEFSSHLEPLLTRECGKCWILFAGVQTLWNRKGHYKEGMTDTQASAVPTMVAA